MRRREGHEACSPLGGEHYLHGGPAPVRRYLPELIDLVWSGKIDPAKVFDLTLPLEQVVEGYRAMDERRAIKALLTRANPERRPQWGRSRSPSTGSGP